MRDLPIAKSQTTPPAVLKAGTTYKASTMKPTPMFKPAEGGWRGVQFTITRHGKLAYEEVGLWRGGVDTGIGIYAGPAVTLSPAAILAQPLARAKNWNFTPYDPPGPVQQTTIAGKPALYFEATSPPPGSWAVLGKNPPEVKIDRDHEFRMEAVRIGGKTVVIIIAAPVDAYPGFLPIATRMVDSLSFATK